MKRKLIALLLTLTVALSLAACGGDSAAGGSASGGASSGDASAMGSAAVPEESGEETPDSGAASGSGTNEDSGAAEPEQPAGTEQPAGEPAEQPTESHPIEFPAEKPAEKPASSGNGSNSSGNSAATPAPDPAPEGSVNLSAFYDGISSGEDFPAMTALTGEMLDALYAGLNDLNPSQCLVYTAMISAVAAEIALVEVVADADVQTVKDIFQARIDYQIEQGAFYPASVEVWENNAKIVSNGRYVMLVCYSDCDAIVSGFNALFA